MQNKVLSNSHDKLNQYNKRESFKNNGGLSSLLLSSLAAVTIILLLFLYSPNPFEAISNRDLQKKGAPTIKPPEGRAILHCDIFTGCWIRDHRASYYQNSTCATIPETNNCLSHGKTDKDFLNWRWKPNDCDLPRFDARIFLDMVQGNKMAFIGDSVAKNQMESLLCLLSQEEIPKEVYKDSVEGEGNRIWHFPEHDFTLMILRSNFLVVAEQRLINGSLSASYNLHIDKVDQNWIPNLTSMDYVVISVGHLFFQPNYLYEGAKLVGCVFCDEANVTKFGVADAVRMAFRTALDYINGCEECRGLVTVVRTFSPDHFDNGTWNTGGICNRTSPFDERQINMNGEEWRIRKSQVQETERARKEGEKHGNTFAILDVTKAMMMRPDGHPGDYWGDGGNKHYIDCLHWCLPGPVDAWNELLMVILEIETGLVSPVAQPIG